MCSIIGGLTKVNYANLTTTDPNADHMVEWCEVFALFARVFAYIGVMEIGDNSDVDETRSNETNPLRRAKETGYSYGTSNNVGDLESGFSSTGSSSNCKEELYDGKLCVICYDEQRNCFFVPCGHCATCYDCAQRIYHGENKVCPVCRRFMGKVRKLFAS